MLTSESIVEMSRIILIASLVCGFFHHSFAIPDHPLKLQDLMDSSYDKLTPPVINGGPVKVEIFVSILTMRGVDAQLLSYDTDIFFHQYWKDPRLKLPKDFKGDKVVLDNKWRDDIWTPDTFFKNSRDGKVHNIIIPYTYLTLNNESTIFYAARLGLKLNCMMDLARFPHDVQNCDVSIMSLQYPIDTVQLVWKDFEITKNTLLPQFKITGSSAENCTKVYKIGTYSCLVGNIYMKRRLGFFLINKFIPSILIVLMSFVTFWIPPTAYPARVTLSVTSILTIVTQQYQSSMPSVSYIMALNIWIIGCISFVFCTLLEYTLVVVAMDKASGGLDLAGCFGIPDLKIYNFAVGTFVIQLLFSLVTTFMNLCMFRRRSVDLNAKVAIEDTPERKKPEKHILLDRLSRIIFPSAFLLFCMVYWIYYS